MSVELVTNKHCKMNLSNEKNSKKQELATNDMDERNKTDENQVLSTLKIGPQAQTNWCLCVLPKELLTNYALN